ncbi:MAG: nucleotide exchange factor GrpE [Nitrospina sp.]|nr:nucleotide exchange factor GrpE [Nitrospina sp.]
MAKKKSKSPATQQDEPEINIVDRRSSTHEDEESEDSDSNIEDRLPSYVERLKQEAEEKDTRLREYIAAYKEKSGENDDFRKRLEKDNDVRLDQFKANLFSRLVPILDNLNRAIQAAGSNKDFESLNQGVEMVAKQFARELKNNEVTQIDTQNRKFNPETDEVVMTEDTTDPEQDNTIVQELEPGYIFKDKLIKAAKVKVAHLKT